MNEESIQTKSKKVISLFKSMVRQDRNRLLRKDDIGSRKHDDYICIAIPSPSLPLHSRATTSSPDAQIPPASTSHTVEKQSHAAPTCLPPPASPLPPSGERIRITYRTELPEALSRPPIQESPEGHRRYP